MVPSPEFMSWLRRRLDEMDGKVPASRPAAVKRREPTPCVTCLKPLLRASSRHKCHHGVWCGIYGRKQLDYRSRTCTACNREIGLPVEERLAIIDAALTNA